MESLTFTPPRFIDDTKKTVILEVGVPGWSLHWQAVQSEIATLGRVCSYDRAGYGWSDKGTAARTIQNIVGELNALLNAAQETGPYLLVGHSLGGPIALAYQNAFPDQVKGIVLVDAWGRELFSPTPGVIKNTMSLVDTLRTMARFGIVRLAGEIGLLSLDEQLQAELLPEQLRPVYRSAYYQEKFWDTWHGELQAFEENARLIASFRPLNSLPSQVIQAGRRLPNDYPSDKIWNQTQQSLVALSSQGKLVTTENSGHFIQLEQPEAILQAIQQIFAAIQK